MALRPVLFLLVLDRAELIPAQMASGADSGRRKQAFYWDTH